MNCKHIQELLPLYVGRDLEEKRAKLVTAHLQFCAECAGAADEYRESRQLLHLFAPPPFSEDVYAGIRQRVLREIGRESLESTVPSMPQLVASLFRPRLRWTIATALLLAVSVFAFYFIANRRNDRRQLAGGNPTIERTIRDEQAGLQGNKSTASPAPLPSRKESNGPSLTSAGGNSGADKTIRGLVDRTHQFQRRKTPAVAPDRPGSIAVNTPDTPSMTAEASPLGNNLAEPDAVPARDSAPSEKTLRVEMQTRDRNIRIIWFSHQRTKQDSPGKSSEGI